MTTEYYQIPSQQSFFSTNSSVDPWLVSATSNLSLNWAGKKNTPPSLFDPDTFRADWSVASPATTTPKAVKVKSSSAVAAVPVPSQFISTGSKVDPWALTSGVPIKKAPAVPIDENLKPVSPTPVKAAVTAPVAVPAVALDEDAVGLYKTELCRSFAEIGICRYGTKCQFAHGTDELRPIMRHPKYKTEICKTFHTVGTCPYGSRCRFIHTRAIDGCSPSEVSPATTPPTDGSKTVWSASWTAADPASPTAAPSTKKAAPLVVPPPADALPLPPASFDLPVPAAVALAPIFTTPVVHAPVDVVSSDDDDSTAANERKKRLNIFSNIAGF